MLLGCIAATSQLPKSPEELTLKGGGKVFLWGAVPSQGAEGFFMALLFRNLGFHCELLCFWGSC